MLEPSTVRPPRRKSNAAPPSESAPEASTGGGGDSPPNGNADKSTPPAATGGASDWRGALDAGGEAPPAVDAQQLAEVAQALETPAETAGAPMSAPAAVPQTGPVSTPAPGQWSKRKISKARAKDLRAYVAELQARVLQAAPEGDGTALAEPSAMASERLDNLRAALVPSFKAAGDLLAKIFQSEHAKIARDECNELAEAWAPLALPHYDEIVAYMPWAVALGKTWEIGEPKISAMQREREERKSARAADADVTPAPAGNAPRE